MKKFDAINEQKVHYNSNNTSDSNMYDEFLESLESVKDKEWNFGFQTVHYKHNGEHTGNVRIFGELGDIIPGITYSILQYLSGFNEQQRHILAKYISDQLMNAVNEDIDIEKYDNVINIVD